MDFDQIIERRGTNSIKYDFTKENNMPMNVQPMWVADMDFETVPAITDAIRKRAEHGIFGYTMPKEDYFNCMIAWMENRHQWTTKKEWYVLTPGVMYAVAMAIRALTEPGDSIMIQKPVYYPFFKVVERNERNVVNNPLIYDKEGHTYKMDFEDMEDKIIKHKVKLFLLCNPHNPVGRVWKKDELERLGEICIKHNVIVVSDEIHQDFIYPGHKHLVFANVKEEFLQHSIICTSPSKTFNLAGLQHSNIIIANEAIRRKVLHEIHKTCYDEPNIFGLLATFTAYEKGEDWLSELNEYLYDNLNYVKEFLENRLPKIKLILPEGTYLIWLDFSEYGRSDKELDQLMIQEASLWLDTGTMFGEEGRGFQRINIAVPRQELEKALLSLEKVFGKI